MMKYVIGTMAAFYVLLFWLGPLFQDVIFPGGGVAESYLKPLYLGIILLSGLVVGCTRLLYEEIQTLKGKPFKDDNSQKPSQEG